MAFDADSLGLGSTTAALLRDVVHDRLGLFYDEGRLDSMADRLAPRVAARGFDTFLDYYYFLKYDPRGAEEWHHVMDALSVPETYFWREVDQIRAIVDHVVPELVAQPRRPLLRIWSVPCASGEEPLTLAMMLEQCGWFQRAPIEIHAGDASPAALRRAAQGVFRDRALRALPDAFKRRYFRPIDGGWRVDEQLHARVRSWHRFNLVSTDDLTMLRHSSHRVLPERLHLLFRRRGPARRRPVGRRAPQPRVSVHRRIRVAAAIEPTLRSGRSRRRLRLRQAIARDWTSLMSIVRVVVIDDSAYVRKVFKQILLRSPFIEVVATARDGAEGLEIVREFKPDVVTCDLNMPTMDGVEFVRQQMARQPLPIIISSIASAVRRAGAVGARRRGHRFRPQADRARDREADEDRRRADREGQGRRPIAIEEPPRCRRHGRRPRRRGRNLDAHSWCRRRAGRDRRLDRRSAGAEAPGRAVARGLSGARRHRAAHAGRLHRDVCPQAGRAGETDRDRSPRRRTGRGRARLSRAGRPPPYVPSEVDSRGDAARSPAARYPAPPLGGCACSNRRPRSTGALCSGSC